MKRVNRNSRTSFPWPPPRGWWIGAAAGAVPLVGITAGKLFGLVGWIGPSILIALVLFVFLCGPMILHILALGVPPLTGVAHRLENWLWNK